MIRYIFSSSLAKHETPEKIKEYLASARKSHLENRLSGLIIQMDRNLLSIREGPQEVVAQYLDWLRAQPECHSLIILARHKILKPMFPFLRLEYIEAHNGMDLSHSMQETLEKIFNVCPNDADEQYTLQVIHDFFHGKWQHRQIAYMPLKNIKF